VLETAGRLFADHGFDDVTMAGSPRKPTSPATVFSYFGRSTH
jgi:hypothetical protein